MSLLEQDVTKKLQINKTISFLELFKINSKKYKIETIYNCIIYTGK